MPTSGHFEDYMIGLATDATPDGAADYVMTHDASAGTVKKVLLDTLAAALIGGPVGLYDAYVNIQDQKTAGVSAGTFTLGDWRTRDLNTEQADTAGIASVASNQITLAAGTYRCHIICPGFFCGQHLARLRNITDTATVLVGTGVRSEANTGVGTQTISVIAGRFTIAGTKVLEVQHRSGLTRATDGLGGAVNWGEVEVYTVAEFWREA